MELTSKIRQFADEHALIIADISASDPEFVHYLSSLGLSLETLKPREKEARLTEVAYNSLIARLGTELPLPREHGRMGEPIWPEGLVGSVTHKNGTAIVAIAECKKYQSLGIDLEYVDPLREHNIQSRVLTAAEQKFNQSQADLLLIFSAKESIYKAIYPLTHEFFGFKDVECVAKAQNKLTFILKRRLGDNFESGCEISVDWILGKNYLFTAISIPFDRI